MRAERVNSYRPISRFDEPRVHLPQGAVSARDTKVLVALMTMPKPLLYADLMSATSMTRSQLYRALHRLRRKGLVRWEPRKHGTLRAVVRAVAVDL